MGAVGGILSVVMGFGALALSLASGEEGPAAGLQGVYVTVAFLAVSGGAFVTFNGRVDILISPHLVVRWETQEVPDDEVREGASSDSVDECWLD